eukprot:2959310-Rhodomonas_salina.1
MVRTSEAAGMRGEEARVCSLRNLGGWAEAQGRGVGKPRRGAGEACACDAREAARRRSCLCQCSATLAARASARTLAHVRRMHKHCSSTHFRGLGVRRVLAEKDSVLLPNSPNTRAQRCDKSVLGGAVRGGRKQTGARGWGSNVCRPARGAHTRAACALDTSFSSHQLQLKSREQARSNCVRPLNMGVFGPVAIWIAALEQVQDG